MIAAKTTDAMSDHGAPHAEKLSMLEAWEAIHKDELFAFYPLPWTKQEEAFLSDCAVLESTQMLCYATDQACLAAGLTTVFQALSTPPLSTLDDFSQLIARRVDDAVQLTGASDAQLVLRLREAYDGGDCYTWHIDKTRDQSKIFMDPEDHRSYDDAVFLVPLLGEPTVYQSTTPEVHARFHALANETAFYYGDGAFEGCDSLDALPARWNADPWQWADPGQASVHKMGWNGAVHSAPKRSEKGRMLLMIISIFDDTMPIAREPSCKW